ncbi:MAG TPA: hypothetical protein VHK91_07215 [Flavisolibacter sp.]|jgi:hypothetical protein|nr:hypothetical protein [Flavisolibacter sp.]
MPRQTFLSKESFVDANEQSTKDTLHSLSALISNIRMVSENKVIGSMKFIYEHTGKSTEYLIDVSILPLNDQYTRISLHGSYPNGHVFHSQADMAIVLHDFESAIHAALKGDLSVYKPKEVKASTTKKLLQSVTAMVTSAGVFILKKKLS